MTASVRRARPADVGDLVALRAEMFSAMGVELADDRWVSPAREWFAARLDDPRYGVFVVAADGEVVACGMGAIRDAAPSPTVPDGRDVLISNVCVFPTARGRGYGRLAFEAAMDWARSTGVRRAELMATDAGRSMYEAAGFVVTGFPAMRAAL